MTIESTFLADIVQDCKFSGNISKSREVIMSIILFESLIFLGAVLKQVIFLNTVHKV